MVTNEYIVNTELLAMNMSWGTQFLRFCLGLPSKNACDSDSLPLILVFSCLFLLCDQDTGCVQIPKAFLCPRHSNLISMKNIQRSKCHFNYKLVPTGLESKQACLWQKLYLKDKISNWASETEVHFYLMIRDFSFLILILILSFPP